MFEGESRPALLGASSSCCVVGPVPFDQRARSTLAIRSNRLHDRVEKPANEVPDESSRAYVALSLCHWLRQCLLPRADEVSHKERLQRDLEGGNGPQRMLLEGRFEMSERELGRLLGSALRRLAQGVQRGADRALGLLKSLPDTVRCGIAQSASEAAERLPYIAAAYRLTEKLPQAVGVEKQAFDLASSPNTERSSAAGSPTAITAEDTPRADRSATQMLPVIASQNPMPNQISNLFAMRTSHEFQLAKHRINVLLGTTNPLTHESLPSPDRTKRVRLCQTKPEAG